MKRSGIGSTPLSGVGTARWYRPGDLTLPEQPDASTVDSDAEQARFEGRSGDRPRADRTGPPAGRRARRRGGGCRLRGPPPVSR